MTTVQTFIANGDKLIPISEFKSKVKDPDYVEGAIDLSVNRIVLINKEMRDYVVPLWSYLLQGLEHIQAGCLFSTYFPDQPIKLVFHPKLSINEVMIEVSYDKKTKTAQEQLETFVEAMAKAGKLFLESMLILVPENQQTYKPLLQRIKNILSGITSP